jgi:hypothetical protein
LHADAQRYTVICEEPNWGCMEEPGLEMPARQHGIRQNRDDGAIGKMLIAYVERTSKSPRKIINFRSHVDSATPRSMYQQRANTKASNSDPTALSI